MISELESALYLVPTPIGNLDDITKRAYQILQRSDVIACEDTRTSGNLFKHLKIVPKKLLSYHDHNENERSNEIIDLIISGKIVALVTDAGSPGISDPGNILVEKCIENGIKIIPLPGATAIIPALTASGLIKNDFVFAGFAPNKKGRRSFLKKYLKIGITVVFYESPKRIIKLIDELIELTSENKKICIAREITKLHEEFIRGTLSEVKQILENRDSIKGEIVVVLSE